MKEIIAFIRPGKAKATKQKLGEQGFIPYTEMRALGRGKQVGLHYPEAEGNALPFGISFLPKCMLTIFVNDEEVKPVMDILAASNRTGDIGDGKIFVCPAEDAIRIRTDERGSKALSVAEERDINAAV